jgi:signal transduction histidine kinase
VIEDYISARYAQIQKQHAMERGLVRMIHEIANSAVYIDVNARSLTKGLSNAVPQLAMARQLLEYSQIIGGSVLEARYLCLNLLSALSPGLATREESRTAVHCDVASILREMWPTFELLAAREELALRFESTVDVPLASIALPQVWCVPAMLKRAVFNLVSNALKYSYAAGGERDADSAYENFITFRATPRYAKDGSMFALSLSSFGVPFASRAEVQKATTFGFRGAHAMKDRPIGSGVGLYEAQKIMEYHNGFVRIETEPSDDSGQHTVVWLVFRLNTKLRP